MFSLVTHQTQVWICLKLKFQKSFTLAWNYRMKDQKEAVLNQFMELREAHPKQALKLLMDTYGDAMNGIVGKILIREDLVEDALQIGFTKIWKNLQEYSPEKSSLFTWLLSIFRNTAIDILRKENNRKIQAIDSSVYDSINFSVQSNIGDSGLMKKINSLDTKYKDLIELIYLQGYTQQEVSDEFKIPLGTIKTRISTAIKLLRNALNLLIIFIIAR